MIAIFTSLTILSISNAKNIPPNFAVDPKPHNNAIPIIPFSTTSTVEDLNCGGIAFCKSYKPDACNTCRCSFDSPAPAMCTKMMCTESYNMPKCIECMGGYTMHDGECVKNDVSALCTCPRIYNPVCCGGTTFNSPCEAKCGGFSSCNQGVCQAIKPVQVADIEAVIVPQPIDFCVMNDHCTSYNDGCNSCKCSDGTSACTKKMCLDTAAAATCTQCAAGFRLEDEKCVAEIEAVETLPQPIGFCTRNAHCLSYHDGCNTCRCSTDGKDMCTMRMCLNMESLPPAKCMQCEDGYLMDDSGFCSVNQALVDENVKRLTSPKASRLIALVQ